MFLRRRVRTKVREATAPGSDLRHASIDGEIYAGDERTFIGGEEHNGGCDFLGLASAPERNLRGELSCRLFCLFSGEARVLQSRSFDWARTHRIHTNLAILELHRPAASEAAHGCLASGVGGKGWHTQYVCDRRVQDNRAAVFEEGEAVGRA